MHISPLFGLFPFDLWGNTAYLYALGVLFLWFVVVRTGALAVRPHARRHPAKPAPHARHRHAGMVAACRHLRAIGRDGGHRRRLEGADQPVRRPGFARSPGLGHGAGNADPRRHGRLYGAFVGAAFYVVVQDLAAEFDPFRWMFLIGGLLVVSVLFLEGGLMGVADWLRDTTVRLWAGAARK